MLGIAILYLVEPCAHQVQTRDNRTIRSKAIIFHYLFIFYRISYVDVYWVWNLNEKKVKWMGNCTTLQRKELHLQWLDQGLWRKVASSSHVSEQSASETKYGPAFSGNAFAPWPTCTNEVFPDPAIPRTNIEGGMLTSGWDSDGFASEEVGSVHSDIL